MQVYGNNILQQNIKTADKTDQKPTHIQSSGENSFQSVLQNKIFESQPIQFSRHANLRINSREISLSNEQLQRVENAILKASEKGIKDSLVLVDNVALVVNVKSKTVVTAMNQLNQNVFTNIDGAVIV